MKPIVVSAMRACKYLRKANLGHLRIAPIEKCWSKTCRSETYLVRRNRPKCVRVSKTGGRGPGFAATNGADGLGGCPTCWPHARRGIVNNLLLEAEAHEAHRRLGGVPPAPISVCGPSPLPPTSFLPGAGRSARSGHAGRGRRLGMAELLFRIYVTSWKSCDSYFAWRSH